MKEVDLSSAHKAIRSVLGWELWSHQDFMPIVKASTFVCFVLTDKACASLLTLKNVKIM